MGAGQDGAHHLRHVEPALVQGRIAPGRRNRTGDEPDGQGRARSGVFIIHAPSSCMDAYKDHPARKRAEAAPKAANLPADIEGWCNKIPSEERGIYRLTRPMAAATTGRVPEGSPWRSQIGAIEIRDEDAISDSGVEIWNLLESGAFPTSCSWACIRTCACSAGRSECGNWPATARTWSLSAT